MTLNLKPRTTVSASAFFIALFLLFPLFSLSAAEFVDYDYIQEMIDLDKNYNKILDYQDTQRCVVYTDKEKTICETYEDTVLYLYKTDLTPEENVINKNTVQISDNTFKIYGSDAFYQDEQTNTWKQTEFGVAEKQDFLIIEEEKLRTAEEISRFNNPLKIYRVNAQTLYAGAEDGFLYCQNNTFSNCVTAASATSHNSTAVSLPIGSYYQSGTYNYKVYRGIWPFDLSSFTYDGEVEKIELKLSYDTTAGYSVDGGTAYDYLAVVKADEPSGGALHVDDYNNVLSDKYSENEDLTEIITDATWYWEFNATGTQAFDDAIGGWFNIGMRGGHDLQTQTPTGLGRIWAFSANSAGTSLDPALIVTIVEEEPPTSTTTEISDLSDLPLLPLVDDLTVITGRTEHWETSTTSPDWYEYHYYRIPFFLWYIFYSVVAFILGFLVIEIKRILKKRNGND